MSVRLSAVEKFRITFLDFLRTITSVFFLPLLFVQIFINSCHVQITHPCKIYVVKLMELRQFV